MTGPSQLRSPVLARARLSSCPLCFIRVDRLDWTANEAARAHSEDKHVTHDCVQCGNGWTCTNHDSRRHGIHHGLCFGCLVSPILERAIAKKKFDSLLRPKRTEEEPKSDLM